MRSVGRSLLAILAPFALATCGADGGPGTPVPAGLAVLGSFPATQVNGAPLPTIQVRLVDGAGGPVATSGVAVSAIVLELGRTLSGVTEVATDEDGVASFTGLVVTGTTGNFHFRFSAPGLAPAQPPVILLTPAAPTALVAASAQEQTGPVSDPQVTTAPQVRVTDASNNPVPGVTVTAAITAGGGTLTPPVGGFVTDNAGLVTFSSWQVGPVPGPNTLEVSIPSAPAIAAVSFHALGVAGPPASITLSALPPQVVVDSTLAGVVVATVRDLRANLLAGAAVHFEQVDGPAPSQFTGADQVTDSLGRATLAGWHLGTTAGVYSVRATAVAGAVVSPNAALTAHAGPVAHVTLADSGSSFRRVSAPLTFAIRTSDRFDNAVGGVAVDLAVTAGAATFAQDPVTTSGSGTAVALATPTASGALEVRASLVALPDSGDLLTYTIVVPGGLEAVSGDGQTGRAGQWTPLPLEARVVDTAGVPIPGAPATLAIPSPLPSQQGITDDSGMVALPWRLGGTLGAAQVGVVSSWLPGDTLWFSATVRPGPAANYQSLREPEPTMVGTAMATLPILELRDQFGNLVDTTQVVFGAADTVLTDTLGRVSPTQWVMPAQTGQVSLSVNVLHSALGLIYYTTRALPGPVTTLIVERGNNGPGFAGEGPLAPPTFLGTDLYGNPAGGRAIAFALTAGAGTLGSLPATLDSTGRARIATWTLAVGPNALQGTADGVSATANVTADPAAPYAITLLGVPAQFEAEFATAVYKWRRVITADVPDVNVALAPDACGWDGFNGTVDDMVIRVYIGDIDGPGGILGQAGPCVIRSGSGLPAYGLMQFDVADAIALVNAGTFDDVVLHEMGHTLGIGSLWANAGLTVTTGSDPYYTGVVGRQQFNLLGGGSYSGNKVPIENLGGAGTRFVHWRESVIPSELMTGYLSAAVNPMSRITVGSLADLGYTVDLTKADAYTLFTAPGVEPAGPPLRIQDQVEGPRFTVDPSGKITPIR